MAEKSIVKIMVNSIVGFLMFLFILALLNLFTRFVQNPIFIDFVALFNENILLVFILICVFLFSDIFWIFGFPFNFPAPIISGVGVVFAWKMIYTLMVFISKYVNLGFVGYLESFYSLIEFLLLTIVIVSGYVIIFSGIIRRNEIKKDMVEWRGKMSSEEYKKQKEEIRKEVVEELRLEKEKNKPKKARKKKKR